MGQKVGGLFRLNHPTREQGGVLHAVDDFFVGGAEGGQGAVDFRGGHRGRGPDAGWGHPAYTGTVQARSISLSSEMRVADLKT